MIEFLTTMPPPAMKPIIEVAVKPARRSEKRGWIDQAPQK